ncbi:MAG: uncharacterized protein KVP18_000606 [Porospora cf. gigantea A]|uniref:uncharacterized protein n=1 Tax=Porospora cf. gigantea A TaxID=2853593 RepID=UPI00355A2061|nr:MAG: hypothetical protein KVP18_000606 [Porospora cf. gigantea A]
MELHAHLFGCLRRCTYEEFTGLPHAPARDLEDCFRMFTAVERVVTTDRLRRIVRECLDDFQSMGCKYLELRTTPKQLVDGLPDDEYVQVVTRILKEHPLHCTLILSVNRTRSVDAACRTLSLAERYRPLVVGLEFSGDPRGPPFSQFASVFSRAREQGLKVSCHLGEVLPNDADSILEFLPDRVGHAIYLTARQQKVLADNRIPVEICLSSNMVTTGRSLEELEHVKALHALGVPLVFCTDDPLLFGCTLSSELALAERLLGPLDLEEYAECVKCSAFA